MSDQIDVKKILTKCCNSLEYLTLNPIETASGLQDFNFELSSLKTLILSIKTSDTHQAITNILSKCSRSLTHLRV